MTSTNSLIDKKKILEELTTKQLKNIPIERKLYYKDLRRIIKYIDNSIFDDDVCSLWNVFVTNESNSKRGTYVNFFFRGKKVALHRLLFENFIGPLGEDYYLKFSCDDMCNNGKCCNVVHMIKYKYNVSSENNDINEKNNKKESNINSGKGTGRGKHKKNKEFINTDLKIIFD
jgi:hypothetical protein